MDKNAIKKFAIQSRVELIKAVRQKAFEYKIEEQSDNDDSNVTAGGRLLTDAEQKQRASLISQIRQKGYEQVMEEVAYTWFNRFIALRYMEVNNFLPSRVRVFSDENDEFNPEILKEAMTIELDGIDKEKIYDFIEKQDNENLYKYLIITQCNALGECLPGMFEKIEDYTELLFPNNLLKPGNVLERMVNDIPTEDWEDAVQIIGWMYQYYNVELKDDTFAKLKKNIKISKERIPAATQLFTPDWIVRYMVENSLGRIYIDKRKNEGVYADGRGLDEMTWHEAESERIKAEKEIAEKMGWKYYLPEAEQEPEVREQLNKISAEASENFDITKIKVLDPCMGSGHILVYAFDVLMQMYVEFGYSEREAAKSIVENNLYGLDIDNRAGQLAYFAVMMKARKYNRRILNVETKPNVMAIQESNSINPDYLSLFGDLEGKARELLENMKDAKDLGSIIRVKLTVEELTELKDKAEEIENSFYDNFFDKARQSGIATEFIPLIEQAIILAQKYEVVATNPPYMGASGMNDKLADYVKKNSPDSKSDLFAVFIEKCHQMTRENGYQAMITQHAWMFLSSYEKLREKMLHINIVSMAHLGARAFDEIGGEVVQTTSFVMKNCDFINYKGTYCRLVEPTNEAGKEELFLSTDHCPLFTCSQSNFSKIPGSPVAYWVSQKAFDLFGQDNFLDYFSFKRGVATGDNDRFLKMWYEVGRDKCSILGEKKNPKWFPYNKGGEYRKWFGNREYLVNWENDGAEIKNYTKNGRVASRPQNIAFNFCENISYSSLTSGLLSFRHYSGFINDQAGNYFIKVGNSSYLYGLGLLNSKIADFCIRIKNSTLNTTADDFAGIPICINYLSSDEVEHLVAECEDKSKKDWDSYETSWDFKKNPLV
ncbi:MAG: BREX-1 system adenine-specific DNA-methyltransferase PglX [Ruminococcaceae bacterium]|nr:BREX-1 system adenine-specific DNA-methyltransferase PglX [Oscillospiraceae bacterium]